MKPLAFWPGLLQVHLMVLAHLGSIDRVDIASGLVGCDRLDDSASSSNARRGERRFHRRLVNGMTWVRNASIGQGQSAGPSWHARFADRGALQETGRPALRPCQPGLVPALGCGDPLEDRRLDLAMQGADDIKDQWQVIATAALHHAEAEQRGPPRIGGARILEISPANSPSGMG